MAIKLAKITDLTSGYQPLDAELTALAGLVSATNTIPYFTGSGTAGLISSTAYGQSILNVANGNALITLIADSELSALASVTSAANALPYFTGSGTASTTTLSSFMRTVLDDASAAAAATTLGVLPLAGGTMTGSLTLNADPSSALHAATKQYVDNLSLGLDAKGSVIVATTGNIALTAPQTIDSVAVIAGDRVLVKSQTAPAENGIYLVAAGAWTRTTDANSWLELPGAFVFVERGTINADTGWLCTVDSGGTLSSTPVTFVQFSGGGSITAGTGIAVSGTQVSLAPIAANSFLANNTGSSAVPAAITTTQAKTLLAIAVGDVSGAAPLASPTFTGIPAAPTAGAGTNTTQVATTAFVDAATKVYSIYATVANSTGNSTITPATTTRRSPFIVTVTGVASTRIIILATAGRTAGDVIDCKFVLPATASIVIEIRSATSGGTLLDTITTDTSGDAAYAVCVYSGSAWVLLNTQYPA